MLVRLNIGMLRRESSKTPSLWHAIWMVGKIDGTDCVLSREAFERVNKEVFGTGIGTMLHDVLRPVVSAVDAIAGTKLKSCDGCAARELKLNNL